MVVPHPPIPVQPGGRYELRASFRGTTNDPHAVRAAVFAAAAAAVDPYAEEESPRQLVRMTYQRILCTCPLRDGAHTYTSLCPPPTAELIETSDDGGRTWQLVP